MDIGVVNLGEDVVSEVSISCNSVFLSPPLAIGWCSSLDSPVRGAGNLWEGSEVSISVSCLPLSNDSHCLVRVSVGYCKVLSRQCLLWGFCVP